MTPEYVQLANLQWVELEKECGWVDPSVTGPLVWQFPPVCASGHSSCHSVWAGWINEGGAKFLDHQYIYDASQFLNLVGGDWKVYRKNIRKYPHRNPSQYQYLLLPYGSYEKEIEEMLINWTKDKEIYDPETLVRFFFEGEFRFGLVQKDKLIGINVADFNWFHGIFRYCLDNGEPFLNEYLRHCFYVSEFAQNHRWINDGGDLGNEGLTAFKKKLNPHCIMKVYST